MLPHPSIISCHVHDRCQLARFSRCWANVFGVLLHISCERFSTLWRCFHVLWGWCGYFSRCLQHILYHSVCDVSWLVFCVVKAAKVPFNCHKESDFFLLGFDLELHNTVCFTSNYGTFNTVLFFVLLLASYVALLKSFKKQRQNAMKLRPNANLSKESTRKGQLARERKFVVAIFIQVLLVSITALPNMIFMITEFYCIKCKFNQEMIIVRNILQNIVLLKFAADPFIYAWRIPRYRRALQLAVRCNKGPRAEVRMVLHHGPMKGTNI